MGRFTENGFEVDGVVAIRERLSEKASEVFAPILNGAELSTDDSSVLGRIFGIVAEPIASLEESVQDFIANIDPNQAANTLLDDFLYLNGMTRYGSTPAVADLVVLGVIGSQIVNGSAKSKITGDVFNFTENILFSNTRCNGVRIVIPTVSPGDIYTLTYSVDGKPSTNEPISVQSFDGDTKEDVAQRLATMIQNQTSDLTAKSNGDSIEVYIVLRTAIGDFDVSPTLSIDASFIPVVAMSATYSAISQDVGTITSKGSGVSIGWLSVTNPYASSPSKDVETDQEARKRWYRYKARDGFGEYDHLYIALMSVPGVSFVNIQKNITSNELNGRVNQGISVIVQGGDGDEIAQAIFDNISVGTATDGLLEYFAKDIINNTHSIKLSRPVHTPIKITMSLKALPNFPTNGKSIIKQSIIDYFNRLDVGEDILYSRLFDPINSTQGFSVNNLQIGRVGGNIGIQDITIKFNELATVSPENILIGGG